MARENACPRDVSRSEGYAGRICVKFALHGQQDAPGWQDPGAAAKPRYLKPVSSNCRHSASPAWLAREYEGRSAYEWACNPRLGARSSMGGVAAPSPADKMQPVQRPGAAPWLAHPWLVPCVPHV